MISSDLAVVSTFRSMTDAQIAKGLLDAAGIEALVRADDVGGMYAAMNGAELMVRTEDLDAAREVLSAPPPPDEPPIEPTDGTA